MTKNTNLYAEAAMLIRKPAATVFEAFTRPEITTKFWFTKSSGRLEEGKKVEWTWEMFNVNVPVKVISLVPHKNIIIQWGDDKDAKVEWTFKSVDESKTFVTIINTGFKGSTDELITQVRESTGGFSWVLAGLKAYLEHNIELNLIKDRFPEGVVEH